MTSALHLICKRDEHNRLNRVEHLDGGKYRSGVWALSQSDAEELVGGWLYLHGTKAGPSELGGVVLSFETVETPEFAQDQRIVFVFESRHEGKKQKWRGQSHGMAHSGQLINATLPHEI